MIVIFYDTYSKTRHHCPTDLDGDGVGDNTANGSVLTHTMQYSKSIVDTTYRAYCDFDHDGDVDGQDYSYASSQYGSSVMPALSAGKISYAGAGGPDNCIGYDGYVYNWPVALYTVRFRHYSAMHGRWLERDPWSEQEYIGLYKYAQNQPCDYMDPLGLYELPYMEDVEGTHSTQQPEPIEHCPENCSGALSVVTYTTTPDTFKERVGMPWRVRTGGSANDIISSIKAQLSEEGKCCVQHIQIDAHSGVPGILELGVDDLYMTDMLENLDHPSIRLRENAQRQLEEMDEKLKELSDLLCDGGTIEFIQCDSFADEEGIRLYEHMKSVCGKRVYIKGYTGGVRWFFGQRLTWPFTVKNSSKSKKGVKGTGVPARCTDCPATGGTYGEQNRPAQ